MRASRADDSYEVSIGFILICVVLWAGSFNLSRSSRAQRGYVRLPQRLRFNPLLFPMAVMFLISAMAETARAPFDLTEAESELVAGYQTEYSLDGLRSPISSNPSPSGSSSRRTG
jgi:NADH-quinone oxidoreductase subunit H